MKEYIVRIEHGADGAVHYFRTGGEIVRCKDCRYGNTEIQTWVEGAFKDNILCEYYYHPCINKVSDYCSHGERRNENV